MNGDPRDRLIDVLLREEFAGKVPPDLADRILERARTRRRRRPWWIIPAAAAVFAAIGAALLLLPGPGRYPAPMALGTYAVLGGGPVARGAVVTTPEAPARLKLGHYVRVAVAPQSAVRLGGGPYEETLELWGGQVTCEVMPQGGAFTVQTDAGSVRALGTRFTVRVLEPKGDEMMKTPRMWVQVLAGAVLAAGAWGTTELQAGEDAALPPSESSAATIKIRVADDSSPLGPTGVIVVGNGVKPLSNDQRRLEEMTEVCALTEAQVADIQKLNDDKEAAMAAWSEEYRAANLAAKEAAKGASKSDWKSSDLLKQAYEPVRELQAEGRRIREEHAAAVLKCLTKEQRAAWEGHQLYQRLQYRRLRRFEPTEDQRLRIRAMCEEAAPKVNALDSRQAQGEAMQELLNEIETTVITPEQHERVEREAKARRARYEAGKAKKREAAQQPDSQP